MNIIVINGPNLNLLGQREPSIYGSQDFDSFLKKLSHTYQGSVHITYFQSNIEGEIIDCIQQQLGEADAIIINAGGYTHTSVAIGDALAAVAIPAIEVHISNVYSRESFRHESRLAQHCVGVIAGLGLDVYRLALDYFLTHEKDN